MLKTFLADYRAVRTNDPAATSAIETLLFHPPLHAITLYRIAHLLRERLRVPLLPALLSTLGRVWANVEIHPSATIGRRFYIDHGTGVVIGETAIIGDDCVLFHNVTLGGTGKHRGKRHPSIGDDVLLGTGATLLGPVTVGSHSRIGANSFICMHDVPANCTAVGAPARIVRREGTRVDEELPRTQLTEGSILAVETPPRASVRSASRGAGRLD